MLLVLARMRKNEIFVKTQTFKTAYLLTLEVEYFPKFNE